MARGGCGDRLAPPRGICRCGGDREERKGGAGGGGRAGKAACGASSRASCLFTFAAVTAWRFR